MTNEPRLGFVFVVGRKAEELSIEFKSAFKASRFARVSVLDDESARALVRTAERDNLLHFSKDAVTRVLDLTACHPYFTQLMCQIVFERAFANEPPRVEITPADVDAIVPKVLEAGENIFEWIWDGLPPAERVIFSAIASGTDEQTVITEERLVAILQSQGIRILIRELELAPKTLVEWEMLKQTDGGYKFFVELMRRWVVARKSLDKVKDELDRVMPLAETLYQGANGFYRLGDLERAITQLQNALTVNPNHLKARLLLGEVYRAQGKFDDSVRELEEAYRFDKVVSKIPLEAVLIQRANTREKEKQTDKALLDYVRVLEISSNNEVAKERQVTIWLGRGEDALRSNNFDEALRIFKKMNATEHISQVWIKRGEVALEKRDFEDAKRYFKQAKQTDRVAEVRTRQRKHEIEQLASSAVILTHNELWEEALEKYQRLVKLDFNNKIWQDRVAHTQTQLQVAKRYNEGLVAMRRHRWARAQGAFADVVKVEPNYKDAAKLLAESELHQTEPFNTPAKMPSSTISEPARSADSQKLPLLSEQQTQKPQIYRRVQPVSPRLMKPVENQQKLRTLFRIVISELLHTLIFFFTGVGGSVIFSSIVSTWQPINLNAIENGIFMAILGTWTGWLVISFDAYSDSYDYLAITMRDDSNIWIIFHLLVAMLLVCIAAIELGFLALLGLSLQWLTGISIGFYLFYVILNSFGIILAITLIPIIRTLFEPKEIFCSQDLSHLHGGFGTQIREVFSRVAIGLAKPGLSLVIPNAMRNLGFRSEISRKKRSK